MPGINPQWDAGYAAGVATASDRAYDKGYDDGFSDGVNQAGVDLLVAAKRALFVLRTSTMPSFVNATGTVDEIAKAIAAAEDAI